MTSDQTTLAPIVPPTTAPPATTPPTSTAPPATAPPTTEPVSTRPLVAITDSGDAVLFAADGSTVLLLEGADPDDIVEEGPIVVVDSVVVTDDRSISIVSQCCEPSPGAMFRTTPPALPAFGAEAEFGHGLDLSPDGSRVAFVAVDSVVVSDLAPLANDVFLTAPTHDQESGRGVVGERQPPDRARSRRETGTTLRSVDIDSAGAMTWKPSNQISTVPVVRPSTLTLAGRADGIVYVADLESNVVRAFDANSLAALPASDVTLDESPLSVSIEAGEVRWIDEVGERHVGDATVPSCRSSGSTEPSLRSARYGERSVRPCPVAGVRRRRRDLRHDARPGYPAEVIDLVVRGAPATALDVGCGTGKAATSVMRNVAVLGIEPDARMAVARRHGVQVVCARFEDGHPTRYDSVFSGQAWHWVDPDRGAAKAAEVLPAGGQWSAFWNWEDDVRLTEVLVSAYSLCPAPARRAPGGRS